MVPIIAGAIAGGFILVVCTIFTFIIMKKRKFKENSKSVSDVQGKYNSTLKSNILTKSI